MDVDRPATDEADAIADMWVALAREQRPHGSHLLADANRAHVRASVARHVVAGDLLVARRADEPVGFVWFELETGAYEQDATRGLVRNLYVRPDHRGEGVGSDLLAAAEERLRSAGAETLSLEVLAANEDARRFYRRHGYSPHRVELEKPADGAEEVDQRDSGPLESDTT